MSGDLIRIPVVLQAIQYLPHRNCAAVAEFTGEPAILDCSQLDGDSSVEWEIPGGGANGQDLTVRPGDWIVKFPEFFAVVGRSVSWAAAVHLPAETGDAVTCEGSRWMGEPLGRHGMMCGVCGEVFPAGSWGMPLHNRPTVRGLLDRVARLAVDLSHCRDGWE